MEMEMGGAIIGIDSDNGVGRNMKNDSGLYISKELFAILPA